MALSNDLISQIIKATNPPPTKNTTDTGTTVYGTAIVDNDNNKTYVQIDGSDQLTPVSTTASVTNGNRVSVLIKDHAATITGNLSTPSASSEELRQLGKKVENIDVLFADVVVTEQFVAEVARIDKLTAAVGEIDSLISENVSVTGLLTANSAAIDDLKATKIDAEEVKTKYADIEFANIGEVAIKNFYATSGIIKDLVISEGTVTGELVGVTIKGDLIEAGTLKADRLLIKNDMDGLYYALNVTENGDTTVTEKYTEDELTSGLLGSNIIAKSITATQISVDDLLAFDATIGGFNIGDKAIYSGTKSTMDSAVAGIYLDKTGQIAVGDGSKYVKYYEEESGERKLEIVADSITLGSSSSDLETQLDSTVKDIRVEYALGRSSSEAPTISVESALLDDAILDTMVLDTDGTEVEWTTVMPEWSAGLYIWQRIVQVLTSGDEVYGDAICLSMASGVTGDDLAAQHETITNEYNDTIDAILDAYVKSDTYEDFRLAVETQFNVLSDRVDIKVQELTEHVEYRNGELQTQLNTVTKYFTFDIDGLTIGQVDNPNKVVIDNDEIAIKVGDNVVQRFDAEGKASIPNLSIGEHLDMFGYRWVKDDINNLNFEYVGGET